MWEIISILGWVGWIIGAVCVVALMRQRNANREMAKKQDTKAGNTEKDDAT